LRAAAPAYFFTNSFTARLATRQQKGPNGFYRHWKVQGSGVPLWPVILKCSTLDPATHATEGLQANASVAKMHCRKNRGQFISPLQEIDKLVLLSPETSGMKQLL